MVLKAEKDEILSGAIRWILVEVCHLTLFYP